MTKETKELKNISAYCVIPYSVMYDKDLTDSEVRLYIAISSLANQKGYCYASNRYLAKSLGRSDSAIKRAIRKLEEKGFIKRDLSLNDDNTTDRKIYISYDEIFDKPDSPETTDGVQKWPEGGAKMDRGEGKNGLHNNININNINNNIISDKGEEEERKSDRIIAAKFNQVAVELDLCTIIKLSGKRKTKLDARIKELGEEKIIEAIEKIRESSFLQGNNSRKWKVDFDWLIANDTNVLKILEDKYKDDGIDDNYQEWKDAGYTFK